jgi:S-adenosylmethionine:tRNA ribosyltransferase-isomerase
MKAASLPVQRPVTGKLLAVDAQGLFRHLSRSEFTDIPRAGDLVIANDAATLPASVSGRHSRTGRPVEVRLAGRAALDETDQFCAVLFGEGDFRTPTEDRPQPPAINAGDVLELGPLRATVVRLLDHARFIRLRFDGPRAEVREGLARHGRPIQYAHLPEPLALWDTWTPIAGPPVAFEAPSASFILDWRALGALTARGIGFATITHAAGISSTGDAELDRRLPLEEPYRIPPIAAFEMERAQARGGRIIAIGTTVVRALEHAAAISSDGVVRCGEGVATQRIGPSTKLRIVDAIVSGTHERGTTHYELLRAFAADETLDRMERELQAHEYLTHEFGDSVFLERETRSLTG